MTKTQRREIYLKAAKYLQERKTCCCIALLEAQETIMYMWDIASTFEEFALFDPGRTHYTDIWWESGDKSSRLNALLFCYYMTFDR